MLYFPHSDDRKDDSADPDLFLRWLFVGIILFGLLDVALLGAMALARAGR